MRLKGRKQMSLSKYTIYSLQHISGKLPDLHMNNWVSIQLCLYNITVCLRIYFFPGRYSENMKWLQQDLNLFTKGQSLIVKRKNLLSRSPTGLLKVTAFQIRDQYFWEAVLYHRSCFLCQNYRQIILSESIPLNHPIIFAWFLINFKHYTTFNNEMPAVLVIYPIILRHIIPQNFWILQGVRTPEICEQITCEIMKISGKP